MALIYWLDDDQKLRKQAARFLGEEGHQVRLFEKEDDVIALLDGGSRPDLLIQDLMRPRCLMQISGGLPRKVAHATYEAGWSFYQEVLKPHFPNIPILLCSHDASDSYNRALADDFNLVLVEKELADSLSTLFLKEVADLLASQRLVHGASSLLPQSVQIDFEEVSSHLIDYLARHPQELHKVSWSSFEKIVAEILRRMGYEVNHTRLTRDGGVDIWAVRRDDLAETLYAIDAKKYAPDKILGPEPVRAIYGVIQIHSASVGMIVTTARFGPEALAIASQHRHRISLKDFNAVSKWLTKTSGSAQHEKSCGV